MSKTDPRIDAYIEKAQPFAQPILAHVRALVHKAVPDAEETIKWSMPHFVVNGKNLAGMAAFKAHASFGIWHGLEPGAHAEKEGMGSFGKLTSTDDLPDEKELIQRLQKGAELIRSGAKAGTPKPKKAPKPMPTTPEDLQAALDQNAAAGAVWANFAPSHKREYIDWITEAKREDTRTKRLTQAIEWIAEGKQRNWKYMGC